MQNLCKITYAVKTFPPQDWQTYSPSKHLHLSFNLAQEIFSSEKGKLFKTRNLSYPLKSNNTFFKSLVDYLITKALVHSEKCPLRTAASSYRAEN